ncbi:hypothetical protein ACHAPJ_006559 [Fusarium lateritium]
MTYLIGVFGFCVDPGQSMWAISAQDTKGERELSSGRVRGARVNPDAGSEQTLKVVKGWIRHCVTKHDCCRPPQVRLPSRILDLDAFDDPDRIRLCETSETTKKDPYVTLSYCWGPNSSSQVKTTRSTLSDHLDSITVHKLPQTHRDAIKITRHLGIRFLWIDALCICQDDVDDWIRESAAMRQVYAGSYLTIAADNGSECTNGFLNRPEINYVPINIKLTGQDTSTVGTDGIEVAEVPGYAFEVDPLNTTSSRPLLELGDEPLTSRAWATQERLLPQRILHFGTKQLFFECNHHFLSEDGVEVLDRWNSLLPGGNKMFEESSRKSRNSATHQLWYSILENYTGRLLTAKTDRLPAISGLAELIQAKLSEDLGSDRAPNKAQNIEYVAGLWSNALIEGLGWVALLKSPKNIVLPDKRPLPGEDGYIAPTWSPASFNGRSAYGMSQDYWIDLAVVKGFGVTPKNTQNPFGEVVDGWISLRTPMIRMGLSGPPDPNEARLPDSFSKVIRLCTPRGDPFGTYALFDGIHEQTEDTQSWIERNEIFALTLSEGKYLEKTTDTGQSYHALLVMPISQGRRAGANRKEFRRVGKIYLGSEGLGDDEEALKDGESFVDVVLF